MPSLGVWAVIQVLQTLSYSLLMSIASVAMSSWSNLHISDFASQMVLVPQLLVYGVSGALLWFKAGWLSERITRPVPAAAIAASSAPVHEESKSPVCSPVEDAAPLLGILLIAAGVFVLAEAVPELARAVSAPLYVRARDDTREWTTVILESQFFFPAIIKCAIGAWLLLGNRGIARLVLKLRRDQPHAPLPATDPAESADGPL